MANRRSRPVYLNTFQRAAARSSLLSDQDRADLAAMARQAFDLVLRGGPADGRTGWCQMADILNLAEAMATAPAKHAIAADASSRAKIAAAQDALGTIHARAHGPAASWSARAAELDALREAVWLWGVQLEHCTVGELDSATKAVATKVRQALAGNAPRGVRVVTAAAAHQ